MNRLRRVRYRLLVVMGSIDRRATVARRLTLTALGAVAVGFGIWGWLRYRDLNPESGLDLWTIAYGTIANFAVAGAIEPVPWQLGVARILAPLALASAIVELFLIAFATVLRTTAARRAVDHLVVLGPGPRARPYLRAERRANGEQLFSSAVHVDHEGAQLVDDTIRVDDDGTDGGWIVSSNAARAVKVVLATGRDDRNLAAMAAAVDHRVPQSGGQLVVELDDRDLALRLSVRLAVDRPDAHIDVVCVAEAEAAFAAARIREDMAQRQERGLRGKVRFSIIGDSALSRLAIVHVAESIKQLEATANLQVPRLTVVGPEDGREEITRACAEPGRLETVFSSDLPPDPQAADGIVFALIDFDDAAETARLAVNLACVRPGSNLWIARSSSLLPEPASNQLRVLSRTEMERDGYLAGPFSIAARWWHRDVDRSQWRHTAAELRAAVGTLGRAGWPACPELDLTSMDRRKAAEHLEPMMMTALEREGLLKGVAVDHQELLHCLRVVGLVVPVPDGSGPVGAVEMPDDDAIEVMARQIHANYLQARQRSGMEDLHGPAPAMSDWDGLASHLKAQNRDQARDNIVKLSKLGLQVVPIGHVDGAQVTLDEAIIDELAHVEHDRWARQKRRQGYRYGKPGTRPEGRLVHADLVPWHELSEEAKDKDRAPIRDFVDVLAAAGLGLVRSGD
jgi:RyR domain